MKTLRSYIYFLINSLLFTYFNFIVRKRIFFQNIQRRTRIYISCQIPSRKNGMVRSIKKTASNHYFQHMIINFIIERIFQEKIVRNFYIDSIKLKNRYNFFLFWVSYKSKKRINYINEIKLRKNIKNIYSWTSIKIASSING